MINYFFDGIFFDQYLLVTTCQQFNIGWRPVLQNVSDFQNLIVTESQGYFFTIYLLNSNFLSKICHSFSFGFEAEIIHHPFLKE